MNKLLEQSLLYDFYGELLTPHQKEIYEDVVLNDMSLSEVAEDRGISRQGVHDMMKRCNKILTEYEDALHLVEKFVHAREKIAELNQLTKQLSNQLSDTTQNELVEQMKQLSDSILEEF